MYVILINKKLNSFLFIIFLMICTSLDHNIMLAAYQVHHCCFTPLGINTHVLAQNNNNDNNNSNKKTSVLLSSQPTNTHRLSESCLFLSQACHDSATLPSLTVLGAGTRSSANRGAQFVFTAVWFKCPRFVACVLFSLPARKCLCNGGI